MHQPDIGFDPFDPPLAVRARCPRQQSAGCIGRLIVERIHEKLVTVLCDECDFSRHYGPDGPAELARPMEQEPKATDPMQGRPKRAFNAGPRDMAKDPDSKCVARGCPGKAHARGLCPLHYARIPTVKPAHFEAWVEAGAPGMREIRRRQLEDVVGIEQSPGKTPPSPPPHGAVDTTGADPTPETSSALDRDGAAVRPTPRPSGEAPVVDDGEPSIVLLNAAAGSFRRSGAISMCSIWMAGR